VVQLSEAGTYRLAVRYSPYWQPSAGCLSPGSDGMTRITGPDGRLTLAFHVDASRALAALTGSDAKICAR
jgi:hypothetical protein